MKELRVMYTQASLFHLAKESDSWNNMLTFPSVVSSACGSLNNFHECYSHLEHKFCRIPKQ